MAAAAGVSRAIQEERDGRIKSSSGAGTGSGGTGT